MREFKKGDIVYLKSENLGKGSNIPIINLCMFLDYFHVDNIKIDNIAIIEKQIVEVDGPEIIEKVVFLNDLEFFKTDRHLPTFL